MLSVAGLRQSPHTRIFGRSGRYVLRARQSVAAVVSLEDVLLLRLRLRMPMRLSLIFLLGLRHPSGRAPARAARHKSLHVALLQPPDHEGHELAPARELLRPRVAHEGLVRDHAGGLRFTFTIQQWCLRQ